MDWVKLVVAVGGATLLLAAGVRVNFMLLALSSS